MKWDASDTYRAGLGFFTNIVESVPEDAWERPSPCDGWRALDVLGHVGKATAMGTRILRGQDLTIDVNEPHGAAVEGTPISWWSHLAQAAHEALLDVDDLDREVESPMGRRTVRAGLSFPAVDLFVHGWDLGRASGQPVSIPTEAIVFIDDMFAEIPDQVSRRPGVFAARLLAPPGATPTEALIAFTGRDPHWSAAD